MDFATNLPFVSLFSSNYLFLCFVSLIWCFCSLSLSLSSPLLSPKELKSNTSTTFLPQALLPLTGNQSNVTVWYSYRSEEANASVGSFGAGSLHDQCQKEAIMSSILMNASPYLYPFIVEYSLIAAAFLYIMWSTIGRRFQLVYDDHSPSTCHQIVDSMSTSSRSSSYQNFPALYSCLGSSKGS